MAKTISLNNFLAMSPDAPQYTEKNQHYLISGANPTYYLDNTGTQEEQIAPLIASLNWKQITASLDGNVIAMTNAGIGSNYSVFLITATTQVYAVTVAGGVPTGVTSFGYATGSSNAITSAVMTVVNGEIYVASANYSNLIYHFNLSSWASFTRQSTTLEPFLEYCMAGFGEYVYTIDDTYSVSTGLDLGSGWNVIGMKNYNDKYLAIAASIGSNLEANYLLLWDGRSNTYNYSTKMSGKFIDMKVIEGTLYVAVQISSGKTTLYYLKGTILAPILTTQYSQIDSNVINNSLFNFNNQIGMRLKTVSADSLTYPLLVKGSSPAGSSEFILSSGTAFYGLQLGTDGFLYAFNGANLYYYPLVNTSYQTILYKSHWIPTKNLQGIDIWYDTPPQSGTDAINVTIYGDGQDIIAGTQTITLSSITPTNFLNQKRTRLDVMGFAGDRCKLVLSTVNSGTWRPEIRTIDFITA